MTPLAVALLVASAGLHACWNLLSKRSTPTAAYFLVANTTGGLLLAPVVVMHAAALPHVPLRVWCLLAVTGFFMAIYYSSLAGAYRAGDISVAYPLARSSPVIVVTFVTFVLGRGDQVSVQCVVGIVLVVTGCFLVPVQRLSELRWSNYLNLACGLALLAAVGTTGYSLADDEALRQLRTTPALVPMGNTLITLMYACLEAASASLWLLLFILPRRSARANLAQVWATGRGRTALAGAMIYLMYGIVLVSMAFVQNISYVVAFRQLSIPLGALLGIAILHERAHRPKLIGVLVMFVGLVLVGTG